MGIRRLPAAALLVFLLAVVVAVAGEAAQEEAVAAVRAGLREIAAEARARREQAAVLKATLSDRDAPFVECTETLKKVIGDMSQTIAALQNEHGKPDVNCLLQKASEQLLQAKERAKPHMETAKEKWIPVIKENWATAKINTEEPYVQMVSAKSAEVYQASRDAISPHVLKAHEFADPYFQEAKKLSKSYIDEVAKASKPHVEKLKTTLKHYTDKAGGAYEKEAVAAVHAGLREIAVEARAQREQAAVRKAMLSELEALVVNITQECTETLKKVIGDMSQTIAALQNEHGKPDGNCLLQKASEQLLQAKERAKPRMETAKEEAKKLSKPYIDEVAKASKPHVEKIKTTLKPYTDKAGDAYEKFLETANYIISRKSSKAERK